MCELGADVLLNEVARVVETQVWLPRGARDVFLQRDVPGATDRIVDAEGGEEQLAPLPERSDDVFVDTTPPDAATASATCASCTNDVYYNNGAGLVSLGMFAVDNSGRIAEVRVNPR